MSDSARRQGLADAYNVGHRARHYRRDFWKSENLKFSRPHFRMEKAARIIAGIAGDRELDLLDIGCGPAALRLLLSPGIRYHGIDMAIQEPAPDLVERDILADPIEFRSQHFDIILAQGVFEYLPNVQDRKFAEIAGILKPGGTFVATYWNYEHRNPNIYHAHSNVQPMSEFRAGLARHFTVSRSFPASHNWYHGSPSMRFNKAINMQLNLNIPVISRRLGVEYFFACVPR